MSRYAFLASAVLVLASATVVRQEQQGAPALGGDAIPDPDRQCTESGEKCAGASGFPFVAYSPCCNSDLVCAFPANPPAGRWGMFCILAEDAAEPTLAATTTVAGETSDTTTTKTATPGVPAVTNTATTGAPPVTNTITTAAPGATTVSSPTAVDGRAGASTTTVTTAVPASTFQNGSLAPATTSPATTSPVTTSPTTTGADNLADSSTETSPDESDGDDGSACFPADASVELEDGSIVRMDTLSVGDMVKVGVNEYSRVFMFTHKVADVANEFISLRTTSGNTISLTKGHYVYANGVLVAASEIVVGDKLTLGSGASDSVVAVFTEMNSGLYNPQTVTGNIVVNNVLSSTYTTAVDPVLAHAVLSPFRFLTAFGIHMTALESGGGIFAQIVPRGQSVF